MGDIEDEFIRILEKSLKGRLKKKKLVRWITGNSDKISSLVSRGAFLRLKYGTRWDIRDVLDSLKPCPVCSTFQYSVSFSGHDDFYEAEGEIEGAMEAGKLRLIRQPSWYRERKDEIAGGELFYKCLKCGAVFSVVLPERAFSGSITRIG